MFKFLNVFKKVLLPLMVITMLLSACDANITPEMLGIQERIAYAGELPISSAMYKYFLNIVKNELEQNNYISEEDRVEFWNYDMGDKTLAQAIKENVLEMCREYVVMAEKAKEAGVTVEEEQLSEISEFYEQFYDSLGESDEERNEAFKSYVGSSYTEFIKLLADMILAESYMDVVRNEISITDEEILSNYNDNKDFYDLNYDNVTVSHILLSTLDDNGNPIPFAEKEELSLLADELLELVKNGADFEALVLEYSDDLGSKYDGGAYTFVRGEMVEEFEDWAFSSELGDVGIVETFYGYHIMRLDANSDFESIKQYVQSNVADMKIKSLIDEWVSSYDIKVVDTVYNNINLY